MLVGAILVVEIALLAGFQVVTLQATATANRDLQWWQYLILLVICHATWQLIKLASYTYDQLDYNAKNAVRVSLAIVPAVLLTISGLYAWEIIIQMLKVPIVLLPAPSDISIAIADNLSILWADFVQTVVKAVLPGYVLGCGSGMLVATLAWRFPIAGRGLLPLGSFMSVMPLVGIAPIMVMWFGFDWQSKAAVAALMTFFPMLVNSLAGLNAAKALERDLMHTYAASPQLYFRKLILPAAMPFLFNGLKVCSTLALIGAIVAEFFGTPIVGMGFRISSEVGRMGLDLVWATIVTSALAGTGMYGMLVVLEKVATFWDVSQRTS